MIAKVRMVKCGGIKMSEEHNVRKEFLQYCSPLIGQEEIDEVVDTLKSGWVTRGPKTSIFEKKFAEFLGVKHAVATNSCTAALHLALVSLGVKPGDEVITTPMTFVSTVNTILHAGAKPVFADIDIKTGTIDPEKIKEKITSKTKGIVPVHYAGHACDMDAILQIAKEHNLFVSEDCAHAVYTKYKGKNAGTIGNAGSFSFYATKNLVTGEGGMFTTNDDSVADTARVLSLHGMSKNAWNRYTNEGSWYYEVMYPGFKYNMTDIQASLGIHQLDKLDKMQKVRLEIAQMYNDAFKDMDEIIIPYVSDYERPSWHLYYIRLVPEKLNINRNDFIKELNSMNIGTSVHFIPVHLHPYYRDTFGYKRGDYPAAEAFYDQIISIPLYPKMTREDAEDVIYAVRRIVARYKK